VRLRSKGNAPIALFYFQGLANPRTPVAVFLGRGGLGLKVRPRNTVTNIGHVPLFLPGTQEATRIRCFLPMW
jgi:hypothetical protein